MPRKKKIQMQVDKIPSEFIGIARDAIIKRIPETLLSKFPTPEIDSLYVSILTKFVEETLPEGSTILQILVAERAAYYWAKGHEHETDKTKPKITEEYKFYVYEFNRNLEILRQLAIRNLPAQQVRLLAKKTINVIERIVKDPENRDAIIKEIVSEFTIEVHSTGFKKMIAEVKR